MDLKNARKKAGGDQDAGKGNDPDFMTSLARGLSVIECFAEQKQPLSIAKVSESTGLSRASVRRCLHTLRCLGLVEQQGPAYALLPGVLRLGYAYLSSNSLASAAQPMLERFAIQTGETCSLGVRDGDEICYVARAETASIMSVALRVGSRLPLYCTSMGRVLLASLPRTEQITYLNRAHLARRTPQTVIDPEKLLLIFEAVRRQGYALVDQELELGLRSLAVPVSASNGSVVGALNIGTQSLKTPEDVLLREHLPSLKQMAGDLGRYLLR